MIDGGWHLFGDIYIYPYGICMACGVLACFAFLYLTMLKKNFNDEAIYKILFIGVFATLFGVFMAMIFQGIYDVIDGKKFTLGSMTFYGGLIGGVGGFVAVWNLYVYVVAPRTKFKTLQNNMNAGLTDAIPFIPAGIAIAHAFGRLGCTFAGCCHGARTDAWYGIYMYTNEYGYAKVVPTQLFECAFLVVLSVVMILLYYKFKFNCNFGLYSIAYGIWRFCIEYARDDYRGSFIAGLTPSQFWSIVMVVLGIAYFFVYKYVFKPRMKHPELQPAVREKKVKAAATATATATADGGAVVSDEVASEEVVSNELSSDVPASDVPEERKDKEE